MSELQIHPLRHLAWLIAMPVTLAASIAAAQQPTSAPAVPATSTAPRANAPVPAPSVAGWPHTYTGPNGSATVYQPQVVSWPDHQTLNARAAIGVLVPGASNPVMGTIDVAFATDTNMATRTVSLSSPRLVATHFPSADAAQATQFEDRIRVAVSALPIKLVPLDAIVLSDGAASNTPAPNVVLDNTPPRIFVSARPASLVVFDGEPVMTPVAGTTLTVAINTNWDVFQDGTSKTWYLLVNGAWLAAPDAKGPWMPAGKLPATFAALPADANFSTVKAAIPGRGLSIADMPTVFVSTVPAAIIVTTGAPQYTAIAGTRLQYVNNSDAALFRDTASGRYYYLVSGRWFAATGLGGPWTFATATLPPDFARIPANGPRGFVLVSVPGTPQAQQAVREAQIPQQGTLSRATATVTVTYAGVPRFEPIAGTPMQYAVNTSYAVIRVDNNYYSVWQGAWFTAPAPAGPWVLAANVPAVIYTIPPSSPLYAVTYVKVISSTPETVTYVYTSGYTMSYVSAGVVVYGTGYYYPPYLYPALVPIYYPYPYSYAGATYYNAATGAWAQGGAIYGPYGGGAKAGYAYNPNTGAYAQGGAIYGPNGGAGAFSAYNPSTGSYAHGSGSCNSGNCSGSASWYNGNTGRSGSTQQNSNEYGRWGSSTISGPNQTVHTQSQSNARGSAGSFNSSSGAKGAGVSGAGGNSAGAVKTSGGDVYAGADGNVYKKTDSGWQKYDNGSWNSVQTPTNPRTTTGQTPSAANTQAQTARTAGQTSGAASTQASTARTNAGAATTAGRGASEARSPGAYNANAASERASGSRSEGFGQLEQDRQARTMGAQRQQQFGAARSGGFAGRGGGGGGGGFRR
ncbi:MAG: hypothetical protein ABI777_10435 [Betaproteobacteria bacterium]